MPELTMLGWDEAWSDAFEPYRSEGLVPGRVTVQHRGAYDVLTSDGESRARLPGRARQEWSPVELPVVGDWVGLEKGPRGAPVVRIVLPRRTAFSRRTPVDAGGGGREQVIAANIDLVFVTLPAVAEVDRRVLERYLTLVWESGARPVLLRTKGDLATEAGSAKAIADVEAPVARVPVVVVSVRTGQGLEAVRSELGEGITGALVGPSGAGKSTLVNALAGEERLATGDVTAEGTGRHTTTRRELVVLPGGGLLVDNPGMRDVHLWLADEGFDEAFDDIAALSAECRFADCRHESEPGCAVRAAVEDGRLEADRLLGYLAQRHELAELEERLVQRERSRARRGRPGAGAS